MDCITAARGVEAGNVTTLDEVKTVLAVCPQICQSVWGTADFDLAGPGVLGAIGIQTFLLAVFGLLQAIVSYFIPPSATSSTRLLVARLQAIFDTAYRTSTILALAILATSFVRLRNGVKAYESTMMQDTLCIQIGLIWIAFISHIIQREPVGVKLNPQRCGDGRVWIFGQVFTTIVYYLQSKDGWTHKKLVTKLCSKLTPEAIGSANQQFPQPLDSTPPTRARISPFSWGV